MAYTPITKRLIQFAKEAEPILDKISFERGSFNFINGMTVLDEIQNLVLSWGIKVEHTLKSYELELEAISIANILKLRKLSILDSKYGYENEENAIKRAIEELVRISQALEAASNKKKITSIYIDDLDNFREKLKPIRVEDIDPIYTQSAFLEDDVEEAFRKVIGEPYKEKDAASETRDLQTSRITINNKRHNAVVMFKGRGVNRPLKIADCGINGDQLLKLSKNSMSSLVIIQHVNKIEPEVIEALSDHLVSHSKVSDITICTIDGGDTARLLKAVHGDLQVLAAKKSNAGRKNKLEDNK